MLAHLSSELRAAVATPGYSSVLGRVLCKKAYARVRLQSDQVDRAGRTREHLFQQWLRARFAAFRFPSKLVPCT